MMTTMSSFDSIVACAQRVVGALGSTGRTSACAYERHECLRCVTRPDPPCLVPGSTRPDPTRLHATAGRPGLRPEAAGPKAWRHRAHASFVASSINTVLSGRGVKFGTYYVC